MELAGSVEDALKGLEKVHMTIPKPPVKISETKNPRKSKIFKGESYKVKKYQKNKKIYKIQRQQQGKKYWYEKNKTKKPEKPLGSIGSFFGTSDAL